jgi:hypothetical protein
LLLLVSDVELSLTATDDELVDSPWNLNSVFAAMIPDHRPSGILAEVHDLVLVESR